MRDRVITTIFVIQKMTPPFNPPKPTTSTGLLTLFEVMDTSLHTAAFTASLGACFVEVGLLPRADGSYVNLSYNKKGYLTKHIPQAPEIANDSGPTFGEVATEIELIDEPAC